MYAIKVEVQGTSKTSELVPDGDGDDAGYAEVFREVPDDLECVSFSAGNPRVEHITGLLHLYKRNEATVSPRAPGAGGAGGARSYSEAVSAAAGGAAGGAGAGTTGQEQQQVGFWGAGWGAMSADCRWIRGQGGSRCQCQRVAVAFAAPCCWG